jgi:hypothetical protein
MLPTIVAMQYQGATGAQHACRVMQDALPVGAALHHSKRAEEAYRGVERFGLNGLEFYDVGPEPVNVNAGDTGVATTGVEHTRRKIDGDGCRLAIVTRIRFQHSEHADLLSEVGSQGPGLVITPSALCDHNREVFASSETRELAGFISARKSEWNRIVRAVTRIFFPGA